MGLGNSKTQIPHDSIHSNEYHIKQQDEQGCDAFGNCIVNEHHNIGFPVKEHDGIYDKQVKSTKCYNENPVEIVEGFSISFSIFDFIFYSIIFIFLYIGLSAMMGRELKDVVIDVLTPVSESITGPGTTSSVTDINIESIPA